MKLITETNISEKRIFLYPLHVVFLIREKRGHVVHDLDPSPIGVDRVQSGQIVNRIQSTLVLVETLQTNFIAEDLQELVEQWRILVVIQYLLLRALVLLYVKNPDFQLRFYEHLIQLQKLVLGVR